MENKKSVKIYKDIEGNYETDVYYKVEDLEELKTFLMKIGYDNISVVESQESIDRQRPFAQKPIVMRRRTVGINWDLKEVIVELLCSKETNDWLKTKKLCELSGFNIDLLPKHKQPQGFISPMYSYFSKEYEKFKRENNITETPDTKKQLVSKFAEAHIKKVNKIVEVGDNVLIVSSNEKGIVEKYDPNTKLYQIRLEKGLITQCERNEFEVI